MSESSSFWSADKKIFGNIESTNVIKSEIVQIRTFQKCICDFFLYDTYTMLNKYFRKHLYNTKTMKYGAIFTLNLVRIFVVLIGRNNSQRFVEDDHPGRIVATGLDALPEVFQTFLKLKKIQICKSEEKSRKIFWILIYN